MKRFLFLLLLWSLVFSFAGCATARNGNVEQQVSWETLGDEAAFKRFQRASADRQLVILGSLLDRAEEEVRNASTIEDVQALREKTEIITDFLNVSKAKRNETARQLRKSRSAITQAVAN